MKLNIHFIVVAAGFMCYDMVAEARLSPIILVPGSGGCQLEAKLNRKHVINENCPRKKGWYRIWMDLWELRPGNIACWAENIELSYNSTTRKSSYSEGVQFRVPGWGETDSIEYIDPSWSAYMLGNVGEYSGALVRDLVSFGYSRGVNIRGAPYDFRFAQHSQGRYFRRLRYLVQNTYRINKQKKVILVSHSMGGLFLNYFLRKQPIWWKNKYIKAFVAINTPWGGVSLMYKVYGSGHDAGAKWLDPLSVRDEQRSYETGVLMLPSHLAFPNDQIVVTTPTRNYTIQDYHAFFDDINFPEGKTMMDSMKHLRSRLKHPGVDTYCIHSSGVPTPEKFVYKDGEFPDKQPTTLTGDGDGTVNLYSLKACRRWLDDPLTANRTTVKEFSQAKHVEIFGDYRLHTFLRSMASTN